MSFSKAGCGILCGLWRRSPRAAGAGGEDVDTTPVRSSGRRPTAGVTKLVMLYGVRNNGSVIICSGSYYAPRVVVTAAPLRAPEPVSNVRLLRRQLLSGSG